MNCFSLEKYKNFTHSFNDEDYEQAVSILTSHMKNKSYYLHNRNFVYSGVTISNENFSTKNFNQSIFVDTCFDMSNLQETGFSGSSFKNVIFKDCNLNSTVFYNCYFYDCCFENISDFTGTKFSKSIFWDTKFIDCNIYSVSFDDAHFNNCFFKDNFWRSLTMDNCKFHKTSFVNITIKNMNFDYAIFENIHFENTKLPFPTIPYILGGIEYIKNTKDNVRITSQHNISEGISSFEYIKLLKELEIFFINTDTYYPLVNIYSSLDKKDLASSAALKGIRIALLCKKFDMIKNHALQIKHYELFGINERKQLIDMLLKGFPTLSVSVHENTLFNIIISQVRNILLNSSNRCNLQLTIKTNITQLIQILEIIKSIKILISSVEDKNYNDYSIEIRHNSPYDFFLNLFSTPENVVCILGGMFLAFKNISLIFDKIFMYKSLLINNNKNRIEIEKIKNDLLLQELEIKLKSKEVENIKKTAGELNKNLNENKISIGTVSYTVINAPQNFFSIQPWGVSD